MNFFEKTVTESADHRITKQKNANMGQEADDAMNYSKSEAAELLRQAAQAEKEWQWDDKLSALVRSVLDSYAQPAEELSK